MIWQILCHFADIDTLTCDSNLKTFLSCSSLTRSSSCCCWNCTTVETKCLRDDNDMDDRVEVEVVVPGGAWKVKLLVLHDVREGRSLLLNRAVESMVWKTYWLKNHRFSFQHQDLFAITYLPPSTGCRSCPPPCCQTPSTQGAGDLLAPSQKSRSWRSSSACQSRQAPGAGGALLPPPSQGGDHHLEHLSALSGAKQE